MKTVPSHPANLVPGRLQGYSTQDTDAATTLLHS